MDLNWYNKMIADAKQGIRPPQQPTAQPFNNGAMPAFTDPNWKPKTTLEVLGPDYVPPEGGPTVDQLNAHPVWQSILSLMAGAPVASIANSNDMPTMLQNILSGVQKMDMAPTGQPMEWATTTAPTPGQAGWVNPQWGEGALPGGVPPPQSSTNDVGRTWFPGDVQPDGSQPFDPFAFGMASPGSWLDKAQQGFQQGKPSAPVVNPWQMPQDFTPPRDGNNVPMGMAWTGGQPGWQSQQPRGPGMSGADPKTAWGTKPWYS
jgi:hypothetical protein